MLEIFKRKPTASAFDTSSVAPRRRVPLMRELEQRIMFDGAIAATAVTTADATHGDAPHADVIEAKSVAPVDARDTSSTATSNAPPVAGVLVVDSRLPDYQQIVAAANPDVKVIVLTLDRDGVSQIADALAGMHDIQSISIVSHGDEGVLLLGNSPLFSGNLDAHAADLKAIGDALAPNGDILLYGCEVGAGSDGKAFLDSLATATGADVAASTDNTGSAPMGGNWDLEIAAGSIDYAAALNAAQLSHYDHLLVTQSVNDVSTLKAAIATGNSDGTDDVITFTGNITFASAADAISINVTDGKTMSIVGGGFTLSGNNKAQVLTVATSGGSAVSIDNLTITNGLIVGNGGNRNIAGTDSLGAGIYNTGILTITNSTITGNRASAGGGSGGDFGGNYIGGGGGGGGFGSHLGGAGGMSSTGASYGPTAPSGITGGSGGGSNIAVGGRGGSATGGAGGSYNGNGANTTGYTAGGSGGTATNGVTSIGGGGGGSGSSAAGAKGGAAVGGIYNTGTLTVLNSSITNNLGAGGGGGGGVSQYQATNFARTGNGGAGGAGAGGIWNAAGTVRIDAATNTSLSTGNAGAAGIGGKAVTGGSDGAAGTAVSTIYTTGGGTTDTNFAPLSVSSVNSSTANGTYKVGDTVSIQVNFSQAVTVTGTPQLTLETGTTDRVVNYASGSGTSTLTFTYTVQAGDTSADLDYQSAGALTLNSGTIKNGSTDAILTLAAPGAANSIGANKNIVIDGVVPTVTSVTSSTSNGTYKGGDTVSVQVNFSEAVTVTGTPQLTLETGTTDRVVNYASGSGTSTLTFTYTVQAGDASADLDYQSASALALNSGTIKDAAGNAGTLTLASPGAANSLGANKNIVIDGVVPTVTSVTSSTTNGTYKPGDTISVQVNFSEAVTVTGTPQLTLETGTTDQVVNYASGSGTSTLTFTYTVQAGDTSADLDYQSTTALALNGGTIKDAAGNAGTLTLASPGAANSLGNNKALVIDAAPVISNLNGNSAAWAGVGSTVVLDAGSDALLTDTEFGALNGGNGDWAGGSLTVQRVGTAISTDTLGFNTSGALFSVSGSNLQSAGLTFATFTNVAGVLTITYTSSGTTATTALVNDIAQRITYRNDTPAGDATLRFALSDGTVSTTADVAVASDSIYVTNTTDTATIDLSNGVSFSEAVAIAAADVTGAQTIIFGSSLAGQTVSASAATTLSESLTLDMDSANGMVLSGGTLSIGSGFALTATDGAGHTASIATSLSGAGSFIKAGAGTVTLSGINSFAGTTGVAAGTLAVSSDGNLGSAAVVLDSGATLQVTGATTIDNAFTLSGNSTVQADGNTSLSGLLSGGAVTLTKTGTAQLTLSNSGNSGAFSGGVTVSSGALRVTSDSMLSAGTLTLDGGTFSSNTNGLNIDNAVVIGASGATFDIFGGGGAFVITFSGNITGSGALTKTSASQLSLTGTNTYSGGTALQTGTVLIGTSSNLGSGNLTFTGGTLNVSGATTLSQNISLNTNGTISNAAALSLSGNVGGTGGLLTKTGAGTLTLGGTNNASNWAATVNAGTVSVGTATNLGTGELTLSGGALQVTGGGTFSNDINLSGAGTVIVDADAFLTGTISGAGSLTKTGANWLTLSAHNTYSGATTISAGAVQIDYDDSLGTTAGATTVNSGAVLALSNGVTLAEALTLSGSGFSGIGALYSVGNSTLTGTVTLAANTTIKVGTGATSTIANGISGGFNFTKIDNGTLTLSSTNTYSGTTTVSGGTLSVTGSTNSATTVGSGGTLAGTGTVSGAVTVQSGGTLAPGVNGAGTLTLGNGLTIQSGGTLAVDIAGAAAGTGYDVVAVTGAVDVSSATISATHSYTPGNGDLYTLITNDAADAITGTFSGVAEGGTVTAAGNSTVLTASYVGGTGNDFTLNAPTFPVVTDVSSTTPNGNYKVGDTISVTVTFDKPVFVSGGTPTLQLETGTTDRTLNYVSGSGSPTLTFDYIVQAGDLSSDLDYVSTAALALNAATIQDSLNHDALLTLPTPGAANSLGANKAIVVDGVLPTASIVVADAALSAGETSLVTITFSEAVTGFTNADLTVANGTLTAVSSSDGGITWTATLTPTASITDATNLITLDNTGVQDAAGNAGSGTTASNNYAIDNVRPTASIVVADTSLVVGETSLVTITFSEAVTNFTTADLTVANGSVSGLSSSDGGVTWTTTLTPTASITDTTNIITLDNTGVQDLAGNAGTGMTASNNYAIDTVRPTASIVVADTALSVGETSLVTITFSEAVTNFTTADLTVANGSVSGLASSDGGITWTATLTPTVSITDTTNIITLDNTAAQDLAGNAGTGTTASNNYAIDTARPTASIVVADAALSAGETSLVTITFSEAVTGFTNADLTVANGTLTAVSSSDGGITWTATLTPTASITDATNLIALDNTGVQDAAGNAGSGTTASNNYAIDNVRPTASIVVADTALSAGETSLVTISFSEAVTGFTNADLTVANGTLTAVSSSDGGITWTATLTPTASITDATNLIALDNTGVQDLAGNAGTGTTASNNYAIDTVRPTASIVVADTSLIVGETSLVTITFSEAVTSFTTADLTVANGSMSGLASSDGGITWTATLTPTVSITDTTNIITLDNTAVQDLAGNTGTGTTTSNNYAIDTARPTASIVVADAALSAGETSLVTITFSEAVTGFTNADLTVANGTLTAVSSSDGGITWTATLTPTASITDATNLIALDNTGVQDAAGNAGSGTTASNNYAVDSTPPSALSLAPIAATPASSSVMYTMSFSEAVSGVDISDFTLTTTGGITAVLGSVTPVDAQTYSITITGITGVGTLQLNLNGSANGIADIAGNPLAGGLVGAIHTVDTTVAPPPPAVVPPPVVTPPSYSAPPIVPTPPIVSAPPEPVPDSPLIIVSPAAPLTISGILQNPGMVVGGSESGLLTDTARPTSAPLAAAPYIQLGDVRTTEALHGQPDLGVQSLRADQPFSFALPRATFASNDASAIIGVEVRQANGQPLPTWMHFDPITGVVSGQPPAGWSRSIKLEVIARDNKGNRASSVVELDFRPPAAKPRGDASHLTPHEALAHHYATDIKPDAALAARETQPAGRAGLERQFAQFGKAASDARGEALLQHLRVAAEARGQAVAVAES